jgi:hypothetical protein
VDKNYLDLIRKSKPTQFGILLVLFFSFYYLVPHNEGKLPLEIALSSQRYPSRNQ